MDEGIFSGWLKKDGDAVKSGEPLFTLEGEKSAQDIESTDSGTLRIAKDSPQAGATVKVGQVIGHLVGQNEIVESDGTLVKGTNAEKEKLQDASPKVDLTTRPASQLTPREKIAEKPGLTASSPRARRRAAELGVDVLQLQGSGNKGRVIEADVLKANSARGGSAIAAVELKAAAATAGEVSTMRRNIAERTVLSFSHIPHFYVRAEVDATELVTLREHLVGVLERECGIRITLTDFLLRAQAIALHKFPAANAIWQNDGVVNYADSDVGVVVGLPEGLVIPVIRAAQKLSLVQLAKERARLVGAVRDGRYNTEMLSGGATSLSNLGTTRTDEFAAIIAPHQSSILAVGRAAPRPYVVNGRLEVRTTLRICLSVDHRVLDGGPAAEFLGLLIKLLENPEQLV
jgi:pyruvate dehydrogenase E2 component (dihydrolipoamide acetyltransferase)